MRRTCPFQPQVRRGAGIGVFSAAVETERWTAFRSHFGLEAFYCQPGLAGANENGGVEGQIGYFRRNHGTDSYRLARTRAEHTS
jgi:hypothetical protein